LSMPYLVYANTGQFGNPPVEVLLKFLTCPYILVSFWRPVIHVLFSPVQVE